MCIEQSGDVGMAVTALKCPFCGGDVEMDASFVKGRCPYCDSEIYNSDAAAHEAAKKPEMNTIFFNIPAPSKEQIYNEKLANWKLSFKIVIGVFSFFFGFIALGLGLGLETWVPAIVFACIITFMVVIFIICKPKKKNYGLE